MERGNTALILNPFLDGMCEAGADVDLFCVKELEIHRCQGEQNYWFNAPGTCFQKDDMQTLLPALRDADVWVWGTPLYCEGLLIRVATATQCQTEAGWAASRRMSLFGLDSSSRPPAAPQGWRHSLHSRSRGHSICR